MFATPSHLPKLLPWVDWQEWQLCSEQLFSAWSIAQPPCSTSDASSLPLPLARYSSPPSLPPSLLLRQRSALERISLWRLRGRLPLSIESTAELVEALHLDAALASAPSSSSSSSERSVRHQYALAVLRFVNSVVDAQQTRGVAVSVTGLASAVQLPRLLVDVRHEATHGAVPALPMLRYAALEAVRWLYRRYWKAQSDSSSGAQRRLVQRLRAYQQRADADLLSSSSTAPSAAAHALLSEALEQSLTSSQLASLLLPALFGAATDASSSLCLQPPAPLYLHPCTPSTVADHFAQLQAVWQPLLSVAVRRIRRFRLSAVQLLTASMAAVHEQKSTTVESDSRRGEEAERAVEDDERRQGEQWQLQLMRLWCGRLLASLNEDERQPSALLPLLDLCRATSSPLVLELHSQLLLLAPHLSPAGLPLELSRWLSTNSHLLSSPSFSSAPSSPSAGPLTSSSAPPLSHPSQSTSSWSLTELRAALHHAKQSMQREGEREKLEVEEEASSESSHRRGRLLLEGERSTLVESSAASSALLCRDWLPCPLGAAPFSAHPVPLTLAVRAVVDVDMEVVDEDESAESAEASSLPLSSMPSPSAAWSSSAADTPHLAHRIRILQTAVLAL